RHWWWRRWFWRRAQRARSLSAFRSPHRLLSRSPRATSAWSSPSTASCVLSGGSRPVPRGYATPSGHFKVSWLGEHHKSKQYNDAPMPYAIFFDEGKAIHGFAGSVGGPASHGCVRLSTDNAKTLFRLVEQQQGLAGFKYDTTIIVR